MSRRRSLGGPPTLGGFLVILSVTVVLLLIVGAGVALAADGSNPTIYKDDNYSEGFDLSFPHHSWQSLDSIYYRGEIWEAFCKGGHSGYAKEEQAVYIAKQPWGEGEENAPLSKPTHYRVVLEGETWGNTNARINWVRLAAFRDKLFLIYAKSIPDGPYVPEYTVGNWVHGGGYVTGSEIFVTQIDPLDPEQYIGPNDETRWHPPAVSVWKTPFDKSLGTAVMSLVAKVMDDKLHIFFQQVHSNRLYVVTSSDGVTFTPPQECLLPPSPNHDALLNGEVIAGKDGAPLFAFVTKDDRDDIRLRNDRNWWADVWPTTDSTGTCKLWTFDPATNAIRAIGNLPDKYRDVTVAAGDVDGCTPYGTANLQLWGIGWDNRHVYHMQYVFNADRTGGVFNPTGRRDTGQDAATYVKEDSRGYLASCIAPERVSGSDSLQQYARVWWWGSTGTSNALGHSLKYKGDLLRWTGSATVDTSKDPDGYEAEYSPAWLLQGVIYGLPPYFHNGTEPGHFGELYKIHFALSAEKQDMNKVESEGTISVSYGAEGIFGTSASAGLSWTNSLKQTNETTTTRCISSGFDWSPDFMGQGSSIDVGAQAFGIFFVPRITNDHYELVGPDGEELGVDLDYTYISSGSNLINTVFDKTATPENPNPLMDPVAQAYWHGITPYPNSLTYWDPGWSSYVPPPDGTYISGEIGDETEEYAIVDARWYRQETGAGSQPFYLSQTYTSVESRASTNTIDAYAGALGFKTDMKGSLTIGTSTSTTFGQELRVTYGFPGWTGVPDPDYITYMSLDMYLLKAKKDTAFWIPDGARGQYPWCLTWHVRKWKAIAATKEHAAEGPPATAMLSNTRAEIAERLPLPSGLRSALLAKLRAAKAAVDRGDAVTVRNLINAVSNQVAAQSGKAIPTYTAERWIDILGSIDVDALMAGQ